MYTFKIKESDEGIVADLKILIMEYGRLDKQLSEIKAKLDAANVDLYAAAMFQLQESNQITIFDEQGSKVVVSQPTPPPIEEGETPLPGGIGLESPV